jgi:transposase
LPIDGAALHIIQAPKREPRMMRYELTDHEWAAIRPMLPNKARGVRRGTIDASSTHLLGAVIRRTMARSAGLLWPMHHLLQPFVRWRRAGVWGRIMDALAAAHDAAVQMIDTSIVRVHQHAAWAGTA